MGSLLSPVVANIFMEASKPESSTLKPKSWFRYIGDTLNVCSNGRKTIDSFEEHLNEKHSNIIFTLKLELNNTLPFLNILVTSIRWSFRAVYRKPTHSNRYLHANSNHYAL